MCTIPMSGKAKMLNVSVRKSQNVEWQCVIFCLFVFILAKRITPLVCNPGRIMLTSSRLYFQPFNNADPVSCGSLNLYVLLIVM